eukprot:3926523-Prymnesium_polylepis.1
MNVTVERCYCHDALKPGDARFLMPETLDFAQQHNPLFLSRPRWMQVATCISAYGFLPFYIIIGLAALLDRWASLRVPIMFFIGAKGCAPRLIFVTRTTPCDSLGRRECVPVCAARQYATVCAPRAARRRDRLLSFDGVHVRDATAQPRSILCDRAALHPVDCARADAACQGRCSRAEGEGELTAASSNLLFATE